MLIDHSKSIQTQTEELQNREEGQDHIIPVIS